MVIVSYIILGALALIEAAGYIFKAYDFSKEALSEKIKHLMHPGVWLIIKLIDKIKGYYFIKNTSDKDSYYEKIYIGEDVKKQMYKQKALPGVYAMLFLAFSSIINIYLTSTGFFSTTRVTEITRPADGSENLELSLQHNDSEYPVSLDISEVYPSDAEMNLKISEIEENLENLIIGNNRSLDNVTTDLELDDSYDESGVSISWSSSDYSLIDSSGTVNNTEIITPVEVILTAEINYYEMEDSIDIVVTVHPADEESVLLAKVDEALNEELENSKYDKYVELPDNIDGEEISFNTINDNYEGSIILFGLALALIMIPYSIENRKIMLRERHRQMVSDYSEIVSKLIMFLESGLTIRIAFERIAAAYEKEKNVFKGTKKERKLKRYAYEEMLAAKNEMDLGKSEIECYKSFGNRCGSIYYIRLVALIVQNVKRGNEDLIVQLQHEMAEVRRVWETEIRKKGEEASMKLLIPMGGMFLIVIVVIVVPAFMTL
jgi:hypothetical protein